MIKPKKLAIYYAYPSLVNGSISIQNAVNIFKSYDLIVFGSGLEKPIHPDHQNTKNIIIHPDMTNTDIYGYIDSTINLTQIYKNIDLWKLMNIKGIFCDQFGYDFGITRTKQNNIINYIHDKNLCAFVNSWDPDDVFSSVMTSYNLSGTPSVINSNDIYLAQSYQIIDGEYVNSTDWKIKSDKMLNYKEQFGTKMACISTYDTRDFDQNKADYSYFSCVLYNFDYWGFGEYNFSASNASLPFRQRKNIIGTNFINDIAIDNNIYERNTNIGISIDTINHTTNIITN